VLRDQDREKVLGTYRQRASINGYAYVSSRGEVVENDYNLNVPRYVNTFEEGESVDIAAVNSEIVQLRAQLSDLEVQMGLYLRDLGVDLDAWTWFKIGQLRLTVSRRFAQKLPG